MSDSTTLARPYAKAIFESALAKDQLAVWSGYLQNLAQATLDPQSVAFITNPATKKEQHMELLQAVVSQTKQDESLKALIALLTENKRLLLLPEIQALYELHKAEQEKTLRVEVLSFSPLTPTQQQQMIDSLTKRIKRKVTLKTSIDSNLLGGAIIRAGDLVIDGSVRNKLNKLVSGLTD